MILETHEVWFHRAVNPTDLCRATCSCGWFNVGTLAECQRSAAVHDLASQPPQTPPFWTEPQR